MSRVAFADLLLRDAAALLIIKATVVLALASGAAAALQGLSAARRHMLWLVALASCVWLVVSSPLVPAITIHTPMLAQSVVITAPQPVAVAGPSARNATPAASAELPERFANTEGARRASLTPIPLASHPLIALWIIGCLVLLLATPSALLAWCDSHVEHLLMTTTQASSPRPALGVRSVSATARTCRRQSPSAS
jgi:hypothetical protein